MSCPPSKYIELTASQYLELEEFLNYARSEAEADRPGMVVAQIGYPKRTHMRVGFLPHERSKQFEVANRWKVEMKPADTSTTNPQPTGE